MLERMEEVADSVVVGQSYTLKDGTPDVRILLFVVMAPGHECTTAFQKKVRQRIRDQASPRHMPGVVVACPAIPHTVSGKKVELTVKKIIDGHPVTNKNALQNPESLAWFEKFAASLRETDSNGAAVHGIWVATASCGNYVGMEETNLVNTDSSVIDPDSGQKK